MKKSKPLFAMPDFSTLRHENGEGLTQADKDKLMCANMDLYEKYGQESFISVDEILEGLNKKANEQK